MTIIESDERRDKEMKEGIGEELRGKNLWALENAGGQKCTFLCCWALRYFKYISPTQAEVGSARCRTTHVMRGNGILV